MRSHESISPELLDEGDDEKKPIVIIRTFEERDAEQVRRISIEHFRSTCLAAVSYYTASHIDELLIWVIILVILMPIRRALFAIAMFILYLFLKSRYEVEYYIRRHCKDLQDISGMYLSKGDQNHFWVAEKVDGENSTVVGCIGLVAHDTKSGKVVRFTVSKSYRNTGIGTRLLNQLVEYALSVNYDALYLYSNSLNPTHAKFVLSHYFVLLGAVPRGLMRGDLLIWRKVLHKNMSDSLVIVDQWKPTRHYYD